MFTWPPEWMGDRKKDKQQSFQERVVKVLEDTRDYFVETHWTSGTLYRVGANGKKYFCAVGGFCQVLIDDVGAGESRAPEFNPSNAKSYLSEWLADLAPMRAVFAAERELAITVRPRGVSTYEAAVRANWDAEGDEILDDTASSYEGQIIEWNDHGIKDSQRIVDGFNDTIARVQEYGLSDRPYVAPEYAVNAA